MNASEIQKLGVRDAKIIPIEMLDEPSKMLFEEFGIMLFRDKFVKNDFVMIKPDRLPANINATEYKSEVMRMIKDIHKKQEVIIEGDKREPLALKHIDKDLLETRFGEFRPSKPKIWDASSVEAYDHYNRFCPYPLMGLADTKTGIPPMFEQLINHLTSGDLEAKKLLLNWLAYFYQTLEKSRVSWVFKGEHGAGKGILKKILSVIYGDPYIYGESKASSITSNFNAQWKDKLYIVFEEVDFVGLKRGTNEIAGLLKDIIVEDTINIEGKGADKITGYPFNTNIIFFSNKNNPLEVESGDRRYSFLQIDKALVDTDWFELEVTADLMIAEAPLVAAFFASYNVDAVMYNTLLQNDARNDAIESNLVEEEQFARHLLDLDIDWFVENPNLNQRAGVSAAGHSYTFATTIRKYWFEKAETKTGRNVSRVDVKDVNKVFYEMYDREPDSKLIRKYLGTPVKYTRNGVANLRAFEIPLRDVVVNTTDHSEGVFYPEPPAPPSDRILRGVA